MLIGFDLHEIGTLISIALSVLALLSIAYTVSVRLAKLELKVDTIWDFLVRRAFSEAIEKGAATMNSPITITPESSALMQEMRPALRIYYCEHGYKLSDSELMLDIERRFGNELLQKVCIPNKLTADAVMILAVLVAKGGGDNEESSIRLPPQKNDDSGIIRGGLQ